MHSFFTSRSVVLGLGSALCFGAGCSANGASSEAGEGASFEVRASGAIGVRSLACAAEDVALSARVAVGAPPGESAVALDLEGVTGSGAWRTGVTFDESRATTYHFRGPEVALSGLKLDALDVTLGAGRTAEGELSGEDADGRSLRLRAQCSFEYAPSELLPAGASCATREVRCGAGLYCREGAEVAGAGTCEAADELGSAAFVALDERLGASAGPLPSTARLDAVIVDGDVRRYEVFFELAGGRGVSVPFTPAGEAQGDLFRRVPEAVLASNPPWGSAAQVQLGRLSLFVTAEGLGLVPAGATVLSSTPIGANTLLVLSIAPFTEIEEALRLGGEPGVLEAWPVRVLDFAHDGRNAFGVPLGEVSRPVAATAAP